MKKTNSDNVEDRFDSADEVLVYFETGVVLNIHRLKEISTLLNFSALAREAGINPHTLQAKIRRESPLIGTETAVLVAALKRFRLATVA